MQDLWTPLSHSSGYLAVLVSVLAGPPSTGSGSLAALTIYVGLSVFTGLGVV